MEGEMEENWVSAKGTRCTKCGAFPSHFNEIYEGFGTSFDISVDGKQINRVGYHFDGLPSRVVAVCDCGHTWRMRGVIQITDLETGDGKC